MFSTKFIAAAAASLSLMSSVTADYNPASQANVALYYGSGPDQKPLAHFCDSSSVDIIPIGFVNIFPNLANGYVATNFGNQCWNEGNYTGPGYNGQVNPNNNFLYKRCPQLQEDIYYCQTKTKKKILLSLGGDGGNYQLNGAADGKYLAEFLWGAYGPADSAWGVKSVRPLDRGLYNTNASMTIDIDGFDFDIERASTDKQVGYIACINRLRELFAEYKIKNKCSKTYLISGAPQCPLPEGNMGLTIAGAKFDLLWIQFYNNAANGCTARNWITNGNKGGFNYNAWVDTVNKGASKGAKLYLGLLGSSAAGNSGDYLSALESKSLVDAWHGAAQFGGVMIWEATYAENNLPSSFPGKNYYQIMKQVLNAYAPATTAPAAVCSTTVSSSIVSSSTIKPTSSSVRPSSSSAKPTSSSTRSSSSTVKPTSSSSAQVSSSTVKPTSSSSVQASSSSAQVSSSVQPTSSSSATSTTAQTVVTTSTSTGPAPTLVCNVAGFAQANTTTTFFNNDGSFTSAQCQIQCLLFGVTGTFASGGTLCACWAGSVNDIVNPAATSEFLFSDVKCPVYVKPSSSSRSSSVEPTSSSSSSSVVSTSSIVSISISESSSSVSATSTSQSASTAAPSSTSSAETFITPSFSQTFSYDSTLTSSSSSHVVTPTPSSSSQSETITSSSSVELTSSTRSGPVTTSTQISLSSSFSHFSNTSTSAGTTKSASSTGVTFLPTTSSTISTTEYTTSTVCTTRVETITACPPSVTNCPVGSVTTKTIPLYTTICPVTETKTPVGKPTTTAAPTYKPTGPVTKYTTSTVYATSIYTVTSCAPSVTDCPSKLGHVTTEIIKLYTTVCPVTENAKPTPSTYSIVVEKPAFTGVAIPPKPVHEYEHSTTILSSTTTQYKTIKIVKSTATIIPVAYTTPAPYPTGPAGHVAGYPVGSGTAAPSAVAQSTTSAAGADKTKTPVPVYATGSASSSRSAAGVMFAVVAGVAAFML